MTGHTRSFGDGSYEIFVIKTDANGDTVWTRTYGSAGNDGSFSLDQTADGKYIIAGYLGSSLPPYDDDVYLLKLDESGETLWTKVYGGSQIDRAHAVQTTSDGGYIVAGHTRSIGAGRQDVYLIKLTPPVPYTRGDTNTDGHLDMADAVCILTYLFGAEDDPCKRGVEQCLDAADANDEGTVNIADAIRILGYLFTRGPLPEPFTSCGYDETADALRCFEFAACP